VTVVGLGYVGLTLAVALARRGLRVAGVEKRQSVVDATNRGTPHFSEVGLGAALAATVASGQLRAGTDIAAFDPSDYYIVTVGTPLRAGSVEPRLDMIEQATREVAGHMQDGATVILRSTVRIGTTREVVKPILDAAGKDYGLAMCPERTLEGDALRELAILPQIIGGLTPEAADKAAALFSRLTNTLVRVTSPETAEMIKLVDNTSRDVRFAFANEVARACDAIGVNANEVIRYGKLGYPRTDVALPGPVGGPCLEKDPHILISSLARQGIELEITAASRLVNERQPRETVDAIVAKLRERGEGPFTVAVAGIAFKGRPETDDLRGSMALRILDELAGRDEIASIRIFDTVVANHELAALSDAYEVRDDFYDACDGADAAIIANNHPFYGAIEPERCWARLKPGGFLYDYWNNLGELPPEILANRYFVVGNLAGSF
jgi:UDP-N-acetyl-D-mannosaminuronic acid dehydrogenase